MAYEKQTFIDKSTVLTAEHLNHIEQGIVNAEKNAAPVGFGLGVSAISSDDLNTATNCGWYAFQPDTANTPFDYGMAMTFNRYGSRFTQIAFNPFMNGCGEICVRSHNGTEVLPWEYINPPMHVGKEYRTTKRHNGKVVYTRLVDLGTLPASGQKSTTYSPTKVMKQVSYKAFVMTSTGNLNDMPFFTSAGALVCKAYDTGSSITTIAYQDCSAYTGYAIVEYTKD